MDVFAFTPGGVETLDAFNERLGKYALANNVIGAVSSTIGSTLVLSLTLDSDIPGIAAVRPFVAIIPTEGLAGLERGLDSLLTAMKAQDNPKDGVMSVPIEVRALDAKHEPTKQQGYAVFLIQVAELGDDE